MASAADVDATVRARHAAQMAEWVAGGGAGVTLVTCHRVELYGFGVMPALDPVQVLSGGSSINHLFRVASGLESVIVGEDEVLHQVREALRQARGRPRLDTRLHRLFETAIAAGRAARARRTESSGNLAQSAVSWLRGKADVAGRTVVVAGAGRMGAALAHSAAGAGAEVVVASRDKQRAARLARVYAGRGVDLRGGAELAPAAAGVVVALGGPWSELHSLSDSALPPIADISAPPAVPDPVRRRLNGSFLGIDDLYRRSHPLPGAFMEEAERIVARKTDEYLAWLRSVSPTYSRPARERAR
jgi:glutamyl-tRNA reductase